MGQRGPKPRWPVQLFVNTTPAAKAAIEKLAARHRGGNVSAELRVAIARHLREEGIELPTDDPQLELIDQLAG